nr:DUF1836 domain-containing protein [Liquorilactobacillus mali]
MVSVLKNVFSLSEIEHGLCLILVDTSPAEGYNDFIRMFNERVLKKQ